MLHEKGIIVVGIQKFCGMVPSACSKWSLFAPIPRIFFFEELFCELFFQNFKISYENFGGKNEKNESLEQYFKNFLKLQKTY